MVFLDQESIVETHAVVVAPPHGHRVLLRNAQTGQGFAGVQQPDAGARHLIGIATAAAGRAGQQLQEIERGALGGQH